MQTQDSKLRDKILKSQMADVEEELDPLFDYHRIQPNIIYIDDDDDDDAAVSKNPRKTDTVNVDDDNDDDVKVIDPANIDKDDDWLRPPPKVSNNSQIRITEDSTLKELRLRKQELESLTKSAKDVLQAAEESVKNGLNGVVEKPPSKPNSERRKIVLSIQDKDGLKSYRVYKDEKFERLFKSYADRMELDIHNLVFTFDGDKISAATTPDELDMEENDIIEVYVKKN